MQQIADELDLHRSTVRAHLKTKLVEEAAAIAPAAKLTESDVQLLGVMIRESQVLKCPACGAKVFYTKSAVRLRCRGVDCWALIDAATGEERVANSQGHVTGVFARDSGAPRPSPWPKGKI
jgi:hypothetical protein